MEMLDVVLVLGRWLGGSEFKAKDFDVTAAEACVFEIS